MPEATGLGTLKLDTGLTPKNLDAGALAQRMGVPDLATTGAKGMTYIAPYAGVLASATLVAVDALTANDTNYLTFTLVNRTNSAAAMLAATDPNTTKATGGTGLTAFGKRTLTLNGTPANLVVAAGDVLSFAATATGTLANAVTGVSLTLAITPS